MARPRSCLLRSLTASPARGLARRRIDAGCLRRRRARRGMTLVEVLIVVALIAVMSGALIFGSGMFASSRQRAAASLIVTGARLGLTRANTTGHPVRMVFDLDEHRVMLEETSGRMLRETEEGPSTGAGAEPATQAEQAARAEAERILDGMQTPRPKFSPVKQFASDEDDGPGRSLGTGIEFRQVQTQHDERPRTEGRAYVYFWPGGGTERASIQLQQAGDDEDEDGLTVMVSPLTGRAKVERGRVELPEPRADGKYSEREEP